VIHLFQLTADLITAVPLSLPESGFHAATSMSARVSWSWVNKVTG
jgi:hypothetical protein